MGTGLVGGALGPAPVIDLQERGAATEECAASEDEVRAIARVRAHLLHPAPTPTTRRCALSFV